jgi:DNA-directed RNA polymerase specialized sigma24 family protein
MTAKKLNRLRAAVLAAEKVQGPERVLLLDSLAGFVLEQTDAELLALAEDHGPSEIARKLGASRQATHQRIRAARRRQENRP